MTPGDIRAIARKLRELDAGRCTRAQWEVFAVTAFRDCAGILGAYFDLEERFAELEVRHQELKERLAATTPIQYDGAITAELPALKSSDLLEAQELEEELEEDPEK